MIENLWSVEKEMFFFLLLVPKCSRELRNIDQIMYIHTYYIHIISKKYFKYQSKSKMWYVIIRQHFAVVAGWGGAINDSIKS